VPKIIKINRICDQPSKDVSLSGPTCTCTNTTASLLIPDIFVIAKKPFITTQSQVITVHFVYHCTLFYALTCRSYGNYCNLLKSIVER